MVVNWISSNGLITLFKETTSGLVRVIEWTDPDILPINGLGIMTGWGATGIWTMEYSQKQFFRFEIEACHDAFILLSASIDLKSQDFYEICIGGSSNQITSLRRKYNDFNQLMISTPNILGCTEKSTFEIRWTLDGTIHLVKETVVGTETIIDWTDSIPLLIQGVGIMTGWGSDGIWIIESSSFTVGQYCGVSSIYGSTNILSTSIQRSRIICLFKCSPKSACLGVNFNVETKECELLSGGQVIDKSIRTGWLFYTTC
ncbi:Hypothetical predicted protein [Mytilus galloprovincialis]|uniref:Farnesoic acid O-methyl transferase domain-containing protein n=1 Tax=Mytilus galloprovincialis TaxID=29158 RepID=A0A8B6BGE1_MYTGA|nr:Hypothetical predicted protein [Mytilus galloprovincialis]